MAHRMPPEAIDRNIERDLAELKKARWADTTPGNRIHPVVPESSWGDVKTILSWLRGNEMSTLADFFVGSMKKGPLAFRHEFYIDDRVSGGPVQTAYSKGRIGKRDVNAALKRLFATQGELAKLIAPRSNPKGKTMAKKRRKTTTTTVKTTVKTTKTRRSNPTHPVKTTKAGRRLRPGAGTVKQASKILTARKRAIAAGEKPPTRLGKHGIDYRAAEWKIQQGRKKAAAKKRATASKPRATRAAASGRFDTLGGRLRKTGSIVDWFY
jgi:hypothetical protein